MDLEDIKKSLSKINERAGLAEEVRADLDGLKKSFEAFELKAARAAAKGGSSDGYAPEAREHLTMFTRHLRSPSDGGLRQELRAIEQKTASSASDASGGTLVPEILLDRIFNQAKDLTALTRLATNIQVSSTDVKFPVNLNNAGSGWAGELDSRSNTSEPTLIERKPTFGTCYSLVRASEELIGDAAFDVAQWLANAVAEELALQIGTAAISGNGTARPTGILNTAPVADLDASPAPDDKAILYVPTGFAASFGADPATGGSPSLDPLGPFYDAVFSLKAQDRAGASWLMNSQTAKTIAKWRDMDGKPLLQPAITAGMPMTLLGYSVNIDEAVPDISTNAHPVLFGNWQKAYVFATAGSMRLTIDDNVTTPGVWRAYWRTRVGGIVANQRAAVAIKCAAS